jgi:beta-lactamase regulating signal transducer with metallopeptidase domain
MSFIYLIDFLAPHALVALLTSALIFLFFKYGGKSLRLFAPISRYRLVFTAAILPSLIGLIFFVGATIGWWLYGETELCLARAESGHWSNLLLLFSAVLIFAVTFRLKRLAASVRKEYQLQKLLEKSATRRFMDFRILPLDKPQAFVLGFFRPKIYLSRGLFNEFDKSARKTIVAHEKTHLQRRDPLRRLLTSIALIFHLPSAVAEINRQMALIQELIADNRAVDQSGCRMNLAQLLVNFARMHTGEKMTAFEFGNSNIEIRVHHLLDHEARSAKISLVAFAVAGFVLFGCAVVFSPKLHLLFELILSIY